MFDLFGNTPASLIVDPVMWFVQSVHTDSLLPFLKSYIKIGSVAPVSLIIILQLFNSEVVKRFFLYHHLFNIYASLLIGLEADAAQLAPWVIGWMGPAVATLLVWL